MENPNFVLLYDIPYKSLKGQRSEKWLIHSHLVANYYSILLKWLYILE